MFHLPGDFESEGVLDSLLPFRFPPPLLLRARYFIELSSSPPLQRCKILWRCLLVQW